MRFFLSTSSTSLLLLCRPLQRRFCTTRTSRTMSAAASPVNNYHERVHTLTPEHPRRQKGLYPSIEPYNHGMLPVDDLHTLYYEEVGNPKGKPAVVLHGGPGGGCADFYRQFFDPAVYRVVLFDQRGAGRSTPHAELRANTTWHLVEDIETIRKHLNIEKWLVFGGSWGSTLSLAYAETHTERVTALVLRGIFTLRRKELLFFYQEGSSFLFPDAFDDFVAVIPEVERHDLMSAYHRRLTGDDEAEKLKCARAWTMWEMRTSRLFVDPESVAKGEDDKFALAFARIECSYFVNGGWFKDDGQLIRDAGRLLQNVPGIVVQGRYDVVCPMLSAWDLHKSWGTSELLVIPDAGHSMKEDGILAALVDATDHYRDL